MSFYVSVYDKAADQWGITDTDDGVTEYYPKEYILTKFKGIPIAGVSGKTIKVVSAVNTVAKTYFDQFGKVVWNKVSQYTGEECMAIAKKASFVRQIKGLSDIAEVRRITYEHVYPADVQEVVRSAADYTNQVHQVDVSNPAAVEDALRKYACLVLQHKTNGALTAFVCTGNLFLMDRLYAPKFFDTLYLTKQLYGYTIRLNKVRPEREQKEKDPNMLNVFSCSLRFRPTGVHKDGADKELSSPFYTVNKPMLLAMFALDSPAKIGDVIKPVFADGSDKSGYLFNFQMYSDIRKCVETGNNFFMQKDMFMKYVDTDTLDHAVVVEDVMARFNSNFEYMKYLRGRGYSF